MFLAMQDEPTAGMDLESRREIWSLIQRHKKDRVVVLTTYVVVNVAPTWALFFVFNEERKQCFLDFHTLMLQ